MNLCAYPGGKATHITHIIKHVPAAQIAPGIVEVFGGAANLLFSVGKRPFKLYNDANGDMHNLFAVMRDPAQREELQARLLFTPFSEQSLEEATAVSPDAPAIDRAWGTYVSLRLAMYPFSPHKGFSRSLQYYRHPVAGGSTQKSRSFSQAVDALPELFAEVRTWDMPRCWDFQQVIETFDRTGNLLYADPPYLANTRDGHSNKGLYGVEMMGEEEHERLIATLLDATDAMRLVSHYPHPIYDYLLGHGWEQYTYEARTNGRSRTEALYICPKLKEALVSSARASLGAVQLSLV